MTITRLGVTVLALVLTAFVSVPEPAQTQGRDQIDLASVTWLHTNVSAWPITSTITDIRFGNGTIDFPHSGAGTWPTCVPFDGWDPIEGNVWVFAQFDGRWYAGAFDWLRPGQTRKFITPIEFGVDQIRVYPMDVTWPGPVAGQLVGVMVTTCAKFGQLAPANRSNVVLARWDVNGIVEPTDPPTDPPPPQPNPTLERRVTELEATVSALTIRANDAADKLMRLEAVLGDHGARLLPLEQRPPPPTGCRVPFLGCRLDVPAVP